MQRAFCFFLMSAIGSVASAREARLQEISFDLKPGERLAIVGVRGSLRLTARPSGAAASQPAASQGALRARKTLAANASPAAIERFEKLSVSVRREGSMVRIEPAALDGSKVDFAELAHGGMPELSFEIDAPSTPVEIGWRTGSIALMGWKNSANVDLIEGALTSRQGEGSITARVQKGEARFENHRGRIDFDTHSAKLVAIDVDGDVIVDALSGETSIQRVKGNVQLRAGTGVSTIAKGSGNLEFEVGRGALTATGFEGSVRGQSDEGAVTLQIEGEPEVSVESVNAPVSIRVRPGSGASVRASTDDGQLVVPDPPLRVQRSSGGKTVSGRLPGSGSGSIYAKSKTATIRIR